MVYLWNMNNLFLSLQRVYLWPLKQRVRIAPSRDLGTWSILRGRSQSVIREIKRTEEPISHQRNKEEVGNMVQQNHVILCQSLVGDFLLAKGFYPGWEKIIPYKRISQIQLTKALKKKFAKRCPEGFHSNTLLSGMSLLR